MYAVLASPVTVGVLSALNAKKLSNAEETQR
jgi:hypothetical protein